MRILYKYASRSRPENFFRGVENIYINSRNKDFQILASLDADDTSMNNEGIIARIKNYDKLYYVFGRSNNKIHAINRDMNLANEFDILINFSDDMMFVEDGYDEIIEKDFQGDYDKLLHYPDGNRKDLCTMYIAGRVYYERFSYIYHPSYRSLWCDQESQDVAKHLGKYKFIDNQIFTHLHVNYGKAKMDRLYAKGYEDDIYDSQNYLTRKQNNFPCAF